MKLYYSQKVHKTIFITYYLLSNFRVYVQFKQSNICYRYASYTYVCLYKNAYMYVCI